MVTLPTAPGWVADALCAQTDPEVFFPPAGSNAKDARRVCAVCPVREECLQAALDDPGLTGIWGGTSERERKGMRAGRAA